MEENGIKIGEILVFLAGLGAITIGGTILMKKNAKPIRQNRETEESPTKKIKKSDLKVYIKEIYSKYFPWNEGIYTKSAYVAGKKEFAKKLLDNIDNKEEFLKIYNSDYINPNLLNIELDKKYDEIEKLYGIPLDLGVNFDKFNIKDGTLTERIKKLIIAWYKDGVKEVKNDIKYKVASEDWDRVKNTLKRIINS